MLSKKAPNPGAVAASNEEETDAPSAVGRAPDGGEPVCPSAPWPLNRDDTSSSSLGRFMTCTAFLAIWMALMVNLANSWHGGGTGDGPLLVAVAIAACALYAIRRAIGQDSGEPQR